MDSGQLYPRRTRMHRRVTNHINMLADISGFSCHFAAKFQILLRYANLLITVSNHHIGHANRRRITYMTFDVAKDAPLKQIRLSIQVFVYPNTQ